MCFIRILITSRDTYPYLAIRHVKGPTLSFHLHHWGPGTSGLWELPGTHPAPKCFWALLAHSTKIRCFWHSASGWLRVAGKSVLNLRAPIDPDFLAPAPGGGGAAVASRYCRLVIVHPRAQVLERGLSLLTAHSCAPRAQINLGVACPPYTTSIRLQFCDSW